MAKKIATAKIVAARVVFNKIAGSAGRRRRGLTLQCHRRMSEAPAAGLSP
jgi:hypothetical protein